MVWLNKRIVVPLRYRNKVQQLKQENIMEKVYVIVKVDVFNGNEEVTIIGTYADKEIAQNKFNSEVKIQIGIREVRLSMISLIPTLISVAGKMYISARTILT